MIRETPKAARGASTQPEAAWRRRAGWHGEGGSRGCWSGAPFDFGSGPDPQGGLSGLLCDGNAVPPTLPLQPPLPP